MGHKSGERVGSSYCHGLGGNQVFAYTKRHQIMSDDNCLDAANSRGPVNLVRCHGMMGNQEWIYNTEVSQFTWYFVVEVADFKLVIFIDSKRVNIFLYGILMPVTCLKMFI